MHISIRGGTKLEKKIIREFGTWLGDHLLGPKLTDKVEVHFTFDSSLRATNTEGLTDWEIPDTGTLPREFNVSFCTGMTTLSFIECLAHEMVHVKQFAKGELKQHMRKNVMVWKQNSFPIETMDSASVYYELPWEVEAHGRQCGLYLAYLAETGRPPYNNGEFLANVSSEDGTYLFSTVMQEMKGVVLPVNGYSVHYEKYKPGKTGSMSPIRSSLPVKEVTVTSRGFVIEGDTNG